MHPATSRERETAPRLLQHEVNRVTRSAAAAEHSDKCRHYYFHSVYQYLLWVALTVRLHGYLGNGIVERASTL